MYEVTIPGWFNRLLWLPDGLVTVTTMDMLERRYAFDQAALKFDTVRFLETDVPPAEAVQVGETWLYLNKNGTPDLRYSSNRKIPITEYAEITMSLNSASGSSDFVFQISNEAAALAAYSALQQIMKTGSLA